MAKAKLAKDEQILTLHRALAYVQDWRCAVDGGANHGDWTQVMALQFAQVHAFEPNKQLYDDVLLPKFGEARNVILHHAALWHVVEPVTLNDLPGQPLKTRGKFVTPGGDIPAVTVDSLALPYLGFLKLDCEGADFHALKGAKATIKKYHPVVCIEVKKTALERFGVSESMIAHWFVHVGATEFFRMGPDRIYGWRK